jgi:hypothetical protein
LSREESLGSKPTRSGVVARIWENRQYFFLLLLDLVVMSAWSVATGIAPAGDIRAHIFRVLEFVPSLLAGDYTSIQYHGYAFLAGYGVGFYASTWILYLFLSLFLVPSFQAATIASNAMWVLTPFVLTVAAVVLADELGMRKSSHHRLKQALLGATVLLFLGGPSDLTGADPYALSFAFSLLALVYGLRTEESKRALLGLLAFSALSIYFENFGYFFVGATFLGLITAKRPVIKVLPVLAVVCAFSWVQLLAVVGYMSPYIEYISPFGINFLTIFGVITVVICAYYFFVFAMRDVVDERQRALLVVLAMTFLATLAAIAKASFGLNIGPLNGVIDNLLPWRFVFLNLPVLLLVSVYALRLPSIRFQGISKALMAFSLLLILVPVALGTYPIVFDPLPSANYYQQFSGDRVLVANSALTTPASIVAYSPAFDYATVSGPFSQGDPSFFSITAYYEWSQYLIVNSVVANNFMHLTGANELVSMPGGAPLAPSTPPGVDPVPYSQAVAVTPILLEAPNASEALHFALFVNLFGRSGFMLDFVTSAPADEVFGAVLLPGYEGTTPSGLPVYPLQNDSRLSAEMSVPLVKPFVTPPFNLFGPISNSTVDAASTIAASLINFFHPVYAQTGLSEGTSDYSVSSNSSLPIQLAVSYYPYFSPHNYAQNVYHFILLPGPERITWQLPFYGIALAVSLIAIVGVALAGALSATTARRAR